MKIKHIWSILNNGSVINQDNNVISIQNVLEELTISVSPVNPQEKKLPEKIGVPLEYEVTSLWFMENKEEIIKGEVKYILKNPHGIILMDKVSQLEMTSASRNHRTRLKISGFPYNGEGVYMFEISMKEGNNGKFQNVAVIPVYVKLQLKTSEKKNS